MKRLSSFYKDSDYVYGSKPYTSSSLAPFLY
jgi:hypothetical protein